MVKRSRASALLHSRPPARSPSSRNRLRSPAPTLRRVRRGAPTGTGAGGFSPSGMSGGQLDQMADARPRTGAGGSGVGCLSDKGSTSSAARVAESSDARASREQRVGGRRLSGARTALGGRLFLRVSSFRPMPRDAQHMCSWESAEHPICFGPSLTFLSYRGGNILGEPWSTSRAFRASCLAVGHSQAEHVFCPIKVAGPRVGYRPSASASHTSEAGAPWRRGALLVLGVLWRGRTPEGVEQAGLQAAGPRCDQLDNLLEPWRSGIAVSDDAPFFRLGFGRCLVFPARSLARMAI